MLFTNEQYAALSYMGRCIESVFDNRQDLNPIEEMDRIDFNESYREELVDRFLTRC